MSLLQKFPSMRLMLALKNLDIFAQEPPIKREIASVVEERSVDMCQLLESFSKKTKKPPLETLYMVSCFK